MILPAGWTVGISVSPLAVPIPMLRTPAVNRNHGPIVQVYVARDRVYEPAVVWVSHTNYCPPGSKRAAKYKVFLCTLRGGA
jgi:hypothetical protein